VWAIWKLRKVVGNPLMRYIAVRKAWSQCDKGREAWLKRASSNSIICQCLRSTTQTGLYLELAGGGGGGVLEYRS